MVFHPRFSRERLEFSQTAVRHGLDNTIPELMLQDAARLSFFLADLEIMLGTRGLPARIEISSGYRSPKVNAAVGGARNSDHMSACAADIVVVGIKPLDLTTFIQSQAIDRVEQLILEFNRWTHVAIPKNGMTPRRSVLTAKKVNGKTVYLNGIVP
jgi:zinc D-Ala-D-Ala carboxypeptidase